MTLNDPSGLSTGGEAPALKDLADQHRTGYRSVGTMAYEILREAIFAGTLTPGQRLRQETLADSIGISRLPVRSALIQLEADGLVEFHARRGAVVKTLSAETAREVYEIRTLLEPEALRLSMAAMTPERLERIRALSAAADAQQEGTGFLEARTRFYSALYDAEGRPILWEMIEHLRLKLGRYMLGWRLIGRHDHGHSHGDLVNAVASGDVSAATDLLRAHLEGVRDAIVAILEREGEGDTLR
jgi:DNA-binding GntR family transcriptional regulator